MQPLSGLFQSDHQGPSHGTVDLFEKAPKLRNRIAEIENDGSALDRVLGSLGNMGDLDAAMPRQKREVLAGRSELIRGILDTLREAAVPMTSEEVA